MKNNNSRCQDDDDELPLSCIKMNGNVIRRDNTTPYQDLWQYTLEKCEFCERISKNKYSSFIHNARHIIIPLIKQNVYQCRECLFHFTSQTSLNHHIVIKHDITRRAPQMILVKTTQEEINKTNRSIAVFNPSSVIRNNSKTESLNNKHSSQIGKQDSQIGKLDSQIGKRDSLIGIHNAQIGQHSSLIGNQGSQIEKNDSKITKQKIKNNDTKLKNRLLFEEDLMEDDPLLTDLTTECKVNIEMFKAPWCGLSNEEYFDCVSFDELMRPGVFRCKKCCKTFPNRYEAIIHETQHISLKNCIITRCRKCNTFIKGDILDFRKHLLDCSQQQKPNPILTKCKKCGITCDDIDKHIKIYCSMYKAENFDCKVPYKKNYKVINLCDLCFSFCKSTPLKQYVCVGSLCQLGKRFPCQRCGVLCFEIQVVQRVLMYAAKEKDEKKRKLLSNEDRLKNIQHRLKMLKH